MDPGGELPITGVCIVSDPSRCPPNYTVIDKTFDRQEDADLWSNAFFGKRIMRYLCVQRQVPQQNQDVLVDVTLLIEKDQPPPGFTVIDATADTREKATQRKCLCVRWMVPSMTNDAITELIFLNRNQKRPPQGYTLVGDLNSLLLCYKMGKVPKTHSGAQSAIIPPQHVAPVFSQLYNMNPISNSLPYSMSPPAVPQRSFPVSQSTTLTRTGPPEPSANSLATGHINPLSGIIWKMNPKYTQMIEYQNFNVPDVRDKTLVEIEQQCEYDFSIESAVCKSHTIS